MNDLTQPTEIHRYAHWELRPHERLLRVNGQPVKVGGRAFDLLVALVQRQGRPVSKAELMDCVWPDVVVEENNLSVQVTALRKLLGPDTIANIAGLGYQLVDSPLPVAPPPAAPALPALFGRETELQTLLPLIGAAPLLSIVGTGGVGKTTLARAALASQAGRWRDGVHWIDLAAVLRGQRLLPLVAQALGVLAGDASAAGEDLQRALLQQQALVVLDNCEHLLDEVAALLGPLLAREGALRWLATSQEPLRLRSEVVFRLGPLDVPQPGTGCDEALRFGAVALLCERARAADHRFSVDEQRIGLVIELCRSLDGLPLALEMAAARVATLGLQGVQAQLGERLRLRSGLRDVPQRQQTLQQTYAWSYGLMSPLEQAVFRRLEPFTGGFTAQMAQRLCCEPAEGLPPLETWAMLDALSALVDKSLVQRVPHGEGADDRLQLMESARDFARLQLQEAGELEATRRRHARVVAQHFDTARQDLESWRDRDWIAKYRPERSNVRAALAWACLQDEPEVLARLVAALAQMDALAHTESEVVTLPLPLDVLARAPRPWRASAWLELSWAHFMDGHRERGTDLALQALADFEVLGDVVGAYLARLRLIRLYDGRPGMEAQARATWSELSQVDSTRIPLRWRITCESTVAFVFQPSDAVDRLRELGNMAERAGLAALAAVCRMYITNELLVRGQLLEAVDAASAMLEAGVALPRVRAVVQINLAQAQLQLGRYAEAQATALSVLRSLPGYVHLVMDIAARVAVDDGRFDDAALLAGCSQRIRQVRGLQADPSEVGIIEATHAGLQQALSPARAASLLAQGAATPMDELLRGLSKPA